MTARISEAPPGALCQVMITNCAEWHECGDGYGVSCWDCDGQGMFVCQRHLEQMGFRPVGNCDHTNPIPSRVVDTGRPELPISKRRAAAMEVHP